MTLPYELWLGDTLEEMDLMEDNSVDMILCDLPYGTTACKWDTIIPFEPLWAAYRRVAKKNAAIVLTASQPFTSALVMSNVKEFKYDWVWEKGKATGHLNAKKMPLSSHESVIIFSDGPAPYFPQGLIPSTTNSSRPAKGVSKGEVYGQQVSSYADSKASNYPRSVQKFSGEHKPLHPTQKPVALMEYLIRTYTNPGELVLDNTMGSGTTGVACMNTGRRFYGIERDENYFAICKERIAAAYQQSLTTPSNA
jgi:site-specific DNA-methyltransferase (adenine-specific)